MISFTRIFVLHPCLATKWSSLVTLVLVLLHQGWVHWAETLVLRNGSVNWLVIEATLLFLGASVLRYQSFHDDNHAVVMIASCIFAQCLTNIGLVFYWIIGPRKIDFISFSRENSTDYLIVAWSIIYVLGWIAGFRVYIKSVREDEAELLATEFPFAQPSESKRENEICVWNPVHIIHPMDDHPQCVICLEWMMLDQELCRTLCDHVFHRSCLTRWITTESSNKKCPACRGNLDMVFYSTLPALLICRMGVPPATESEKSLNSSEPTRNNMITLVQANAT